jgi:hypothetical protein
MELTLTENQFYLVETFFVINSYFAYIILIPCFCLNIFTSAFFYFRKAFWEDKNTMGFFFSIHTFLSNSFLVFGLALYFLKLDNTACKKLYIYATISIIVNSLFQLLITVDRYVNIVRPSRYAFFQKKLNITGLLMLIIGISLIPAWTQTNRIKLKRDFRFKNQTVNMDYCVLTGSYRYIVSITFVMIRLTATIAMFVMNFTICKRVFTSRRRVKLNRSMRREYIFTISIISMNVLYFITYTPILITSITVNLNVTSEIFYRFSKLACFFNESIVFFMNLLFNKLFRKELSRFFNSILCNFLTNLEYQLTEQNTEQEYSLKQLKNSNADSEINGNIKDSKTNLPEV